MEHLAREAHMSKREAPSKIVPSPMVYEGVGYPKPGLCPLCGDALILRPAVYWPMPTDPPGLRRVIHALCVQEYGLFKQAMKPML
jgi:hypothetical protein